MALEHLIRRSRVVHSDGSRFVCRGPTIATVHLVLGMYGDEVMAAMRAAVGEVPQLAAFEACVKIVIKQPDARCLRVLETCVDGPIYEANSQTLERLAIMCSSLCDLEHLLGLIEIPLDADPDAEEPPGVSGQCIAVVKIAQLHGVAPHEVMDWPYESLQEVMAVENIVGRPETVDVEPGSHPGIGVSSARGLG